MTYAKTELVYELNHISEFEVLDATWKQFNSISSQPLLRVFPMKEL